MADELNSEAGLETANQPPAEAVAEAPVPQEAEAAHDEPINLEAVPEAEAEAQPPEGEQPLEGELELPEQPAMATLEIDGEVYEVPEKIKKGFVQEASYTRKAQDLAERERSFEAKQQAFDQYSKASDEEFQARVALSGVEKQIAEYDRVDWNAWADLDSVEAQKGQIALMQLNRQHAQLSHYLQNAAHERSERIGQETANRIRETDERVQKEIKGWTPDLHKKVLDFATSDLGHSPQQLRAAYSPEVFKTLYYAMIGQQSLARQGAKPAPIRQVGEVRPISKVTAKGGASVVKPLTDPSLSMAEYAARRNKEMGVGS